MSLIKGFPYSLISYKDDSIGALGTPNQSFGTINNIVNNEPRPRFIVLHSTAGSDLNSNIRILSSKEKNSAGGYSSVHYLIGGQSEKNGVIFQMLDDRLKGVHANYLNGVSIGIELVDKHYSSIPEYEPFYDTTISGRKSPSDWLTKEEYLSCLILCTYLSKEYDVPRKYISLYETKNNSNIVSPSPLYNINDRQNSDNTSKSIQNLLTKDTDLSGFIFHKDFRSNKKDPVFFNGEKFINDLNKTFEYIQGVTIIPNQSYLDIFNGLISGRDINYLVDQQFELLPGVSIKESFNEVFKILKDSKTKRETFEKEKYADKIVNKPQRTTKTGVDSIKDDGSK